MSKRATKMTSLLVAGVLAVSTSIVPVTASAYEDYSDMESRPTGGEMLADALLVRPVMLASTVITTAVFVVSLPFSLLGGNVGDAAKGLVVEPVKYTFVRPLGEM
jgi:hypothetical protein